MTLRNILSTIGFIYGYEPSGHSSVAKAVCEFLPSEVVAFRFLNLSDIFSDTARVIVKGYLEIIQKAPGLWGYLYDSPLLSFLHRNLGITPPPSYTEKIERVIVKNGIDFLVSTHAFSSIIANRNSMRIKLKKHIGIITDIYAHSFWPNDLDRYFVPHYETYKSLALNGVAQHKIEISGMPLRKEFYINYNQSKIRKKLKLKNRYTFLISGGSKGLGDIISVIEAIRSIKRKVNIIVLCGLNKHLMREIRSMRYIDDLKIMAVGYHLNTAMFYAASDCVIGKAGGVTLFETAAMSKPFIVWNAIPGQEERNRDFLKKHSYALCPLNKSELREAIWTFYSNHDLALRYSHSISNLHKKDAPVRIVDYILSNV
ncbi:MAG: MGDG synthase family glycosyltransferase [Elusimicrobiales bacterium]